MTADFMQMRAPVRNQSELPGGHTRATAHAHKHTHGLLDAHTHFEGRQIFQEMAAGETPAQETQKGQTRHEGRGQEAEKENSLSTFEEIEEMGAVRK